MTSPALEQWRSSRLGRLDRMIAAHPESAGPSVDSGLAQEWIEALVLRLAAEFQGFCRDLHDEVVEALLKGFRDRPELEARLMNGLVVGRGLDRRSADPKTIGDDFDRLGSDLWLLLSSGHPVEISAWRAALQQLHRARNGVAHDDRRVIAEVDEAGWPMNLQTVKRWRGVVDEIVVAAATTVSQDIAELMRTNHGG